MARSPDDEVPPFNPVLASRVNHYKFLAPQLYRTDVPDSVIDPAISQKELMEFLGGFKSVLPKSAFDAKRAEIRRLFESRLIRRRDPHPEKLIPDGKEEDFRGRLISFLVSVATLVGGAEYSLRNLLEDLTGVSGGVLCKVQGTGDRDEIVVDAVGVMSFMDVKIVFGHPDYKGKTAVVWELKKLRDNVDKDKPLDPLWYRNGEAMPAQTYVAMLGENAPLAMAVMPEGFMAVIKKRHQQERQFRLGWFGLNGEGGDVGMMDFAPGRNTQIFCDICAEIVRLGLVKVSEEDLWFAEFSGNFAAEEGQVSAAEDLSPPRKKPREREQNDEVLESVSNDGSVLKFVRLDVNARFSAEEIEEMYRIHRADKAREED